ncbi:MAG TPA: hypothetical protein VKA67_06905, partial [Verrucomicrobiae bacterium]|nr:hypothetical protein [Verrucomicrobiae bacterium]
MKITTKENSKSKPPTTRELPIIGCEIAKVTWRVVGAGIEDLSHGTFLALGGWYLAIFLTANAFAQGSLTPPGAPAPTMKTLNQIEARMPISSAPFTITQPGSYYLTTNVSVSGGNAITIATNGVTLDLNGFTISSTAASASGFGILLESGLQNIAILNGFIQGGVTNNGSGTYSGSG